MIKIQLKSYLIFILFLLILPIIIYSIFTFNTLSNQINSNLKFTTNVVEQNIVERINEFFSQQNKTLLLIKKQIEKEDDFKSQKVDDFLMDIILSSRYFHSVEIIDTQGNIQNVVPFKSNTIGTNVLYEEYFMNATYTPYISKVFISKINQQPTVSISIKIQNAVIVCFINLEYCQNSINLINKNIDGKISIVDESGIYIADKNIDNVEERRVFLFSDINPNSRIKLDGINYSVSINSIQTTNWKTLIFLDRDILFSPINKIVHLLAFISILICSGMILLIFVWMKNLNLTIMELISKFKKISSGNYEVTSRYIGFKEFDEIWYFFENMINGIKEREDKIRLNELQLESKVVERTKEIYTKNKELKKEIKNRIKIEKELYLEKEKAEEANKEKSRFLANMSHEIRTPINAIIGINYMLNKSSLNSIQQSYIDKSISASKSLLHIVNDILDISKIESGKMEVEYLNFDLMDLISDINKLIIVKIKEKNLNYEFQIDSKLSHFIYSDLVKLNQILTNILNNSVKFTEKGFIKFEIFCENQYIRFEISDSGIGINEENLSKIFNTFTQADMSTTRKFGGTGLGLTICKSLVEILNGKIEVFSKNGQGTKFKIWIPYKKSKLESNKYFIKTDLVSKIICNDNNIYELISKQIKLIGLNIISKNIKSNPENTIFIICSSNINELDNYEYNERNVFIIKSINEQDIHYNFIHLFFPFGIKTLYSKILEIENNKRHRIIEKNNSQKRILLVDDNEMNQFIVNNILEENGFKISIANNGKEALDIVLKEDFDLILMDLMMPVMDGFEATKKIKEIEIKKDIPIIAMTADAILDKRNEVLEVGMIDFISKPINPPDLIEKINQIIERYS